MAGFNLNTLLNERSKMEEMSEERKIDANVELIDLYHMVPSQDNFYDTTNMMDLVQSIKLCGLMQPVILTESEEEDGMFDIVSGHRRREACKYLVEHEGLEKFKMIPCIIREKKNDVMDKLALIMANRFRDKTDWEKMQEAIQTEELINKLCGEKRLDKNTRDALKELLKIESDKDLKTRDFVAQIMNVSATQIARYKTIYMNLNQVLMKSFQENAIPVSVAYECAGLNEANQKECAEVGADALSLEYVKNLKACERDREPIKGQMSLVEQPTTKEPESDYLEKLGKNLGAFYERLYESEKMMALRRDRKGLLEVLKKEYGGTYHGHCGEDGEWECNPNGITFDHLQTNCIHRSWSRFIDLLFAYLDEKAMKADAVPEAKRVLPENEIKQEKTEEQKYDEEQAKIDRETKKKLEEMGYGEEEKNEPLPEHEKEHTITVTSRQLGEIIFSSKPYMVLLDTDYQINDTIVMKERISTVGLTGKYVKVKVRLVERNCTGLEDKYCIVLFSVIERQTNLLVK